MGAVGMTLIEELRGALCWSYIPKLPEQSPPISIPA